MKVITIVLTDGEAAALGRALPREAGWQSRPSLALQRAEQKLAAALQSPTARPEGPTSGPSIERRGGCA